MYNIDKLQGEWKKLEESFGNETPSVDPANDMPILDPANENPMVKYNRAIRDWKVWVAGHPNEVPPPRPKRPAQVGPSQPKMGWKRGGQAVWNKLHEGYKELGETLSLPMENEPPMGGEVDENGAAFKLGVCQAMLGTLFRSLDSAKQQGDFSRFVGEAEKIKQIILSKGVEIR